MGEGSLALMYQISENVHVIDVKIKEEITGKMAMTCPLCSEHGKFNYHVNGIVSKYVLQACAHVMIFYKFYKTNKCNYAKIFKMIVLNNIS